MKAESKPSGSKWTLIRPNFQTEGFEGERRDIGDAGLSRCFFSQMQSSKHLVTAGLVQRIMQDDATFSQAPSNIGGGDPAHPKREDRSSPTDTLGSRLRGRPPKSNVSLAKRQDLNIQEPQSTTQTPCKRIKHAPPVDNPPRPKSVAPEEPCIPMHRMMVSPTPSVLSSTTTKSVNRHNFYSLTEDLLLFWALQQPGCGAITDTCFRLLKSQRTKSALAYRLTRLRKMEPQTVQLLLQKFAQDPKSFGYTRMVETLGEGLDFNEIEPKTPIEMEDVMGSCQAFKEWVEAGLAKLASSEGVGGLERPRAGASVAKGSTSVGGKAEPAGSVSPRAQSQKRLATSTAPKQSSTARPAKTQQTPSTPKIEQFKTEELAPMPPPTKDPNQQPSTDNSGPLSESVLSVPTPTNLHPLSQLDSRDLSSLVTAEAYVQTLARLYGVIDRQEKKLAEISEKICEIQDEDRGKKHVFEKVEDLLFKTQDLFRRLNKVPTVKLEVSRDLRVDMETAKDIIDSSVRGGQTSSEEV